MFKFFVGHLVALGSLHYVSFLMVQGGAIYASHGEEDRVTIDNCTFTSIAAQVRTG